jgi:hypothetical protein
MLQGETQSFHFFLDPSVLWAPNVRTLSETSSDHALRCMLNPSTVATLPVVILLSARINSSTRRTVAPVAVSTGPPGRTLSAIFELP